jgi:hypothetical protein
MMELLQGKLLLVTHDDDGQLTRRQPAGRAFRLLSEQLEGAQSVVRFTLERHPDVFAFKVERSRRDPVIVLWKDGDVFAGEDDPSRPVAFPWSRERATAVDALGRAHAVELRDGYLTVPVSVTPLFVSAPSAPDA